MRIIVPHHTDKATARQKIDARITQLLAQFGHYLSDSENRWEGDTLHFSGSSRGFKSTGTIELTDTEAIIDGKVPLIAKPFESRIRSTVEKEAAAMFA